MGWIGQFAEPGSAIRLAQRYLLLNLPSVTFPRRRDTGAAAHSDWIASLMFIREARTAGMNAPTRHKATAMATNIAADGLGE